jgi:hypothetical protein
MKKIDTAQTIQILANIGVIAGIAFLGLELRQNNSLLREEARASLTDEIRSLNEAMYLNSGGLTSLVLKAQRGEDLTEEEELRLDRLAVQNLVAWQAAFAAYESGILDEGDFNPGGGWTSVYCDLFPNSDEVFHRHVWAPQFRDYIEKNVAVC